MRRLLFIIIGLLSLAACKTDKTSVPQEFECFNQPHIYIKYKQPINGYTVKVMWLQYGEVGNALFCLEKQGVQYYYFAEKWTDKILYDKGNTYPHNTVIELDYTARAKNTFRMILLSSFLMLILTEKRSSLSTAIKVVQGIPMLMMCTTSAHTVTLYRKQKYHLQSWKTDNVSLIQRTRLLLFLALMDGTTLLGISTN